METNLLQGITPQQAPDLDSQLNDLFSQSNVAPVTPTVAPVTNEPANTQQPNVESVEKPVSKQTNPITDEVTNLDDLDPAKQLAVEATDEPKPDDVSLLVNKFKEQTGYSGDLDLTLDGFIKVVKDVKSEYAIYENPQVKALAQHLATGGTVDTFNPLPVVPDYNNVRESLTVENIQGAEQIIREELAKNNIKPLIIEATINNLKDEGKLRDEALSIIDSREQADLEVFNEAKAQLDLQQANVQKEIAEQWNQVNTVLSGNEINGIKIPKAEMEAFAKVIKPNENGEIPIHKMRAELTVEQNLYLDFLIYKGFVTNRSVQGKVAAPVAPKTDLSISMLNGGNQSKGGQNVSTDEVLSELATLFKGN